ncbi:MAG: S-layer homology domain-containing protein [Desulfobacterales bacterium]|jgi:tetratricopeptide (TPR) repeat protein|nr:S-layer homology domain-containing protein [Desulfobacterales bacterium]
MAIKKISILLTAASMLMMFACAPKPLPTRTEIDTPLHHANNGNKLLKAGKLDAAFSEFTRARELDSQYAPAYVGLGLVDAFRGDFESGLENLKTAKKFAEGKEQRASIHIGHMRLYTVGGEKLDTNWLKRVRSEFEDAADLIPDRAEPYFYMGMASKQGYEFDKAADQFSRVLDIGQDFVAEAEKEYVLVQKIVRAMPGSKVGKQIALVEKLTRGDTAALFIEELKVDALYRKKTGKTFDASYKSPEKEFITGQYVRAPAVTDIEDHVLKTDIEAVMDVGIKGLEAFPDHTFKPDAAINRAEFAMMIEEILIKITQVNDLATRFIGSTSPFPDLRSDLPCFNAVMLCTTRGIMAVRDLSTGEFDPMGPVSGADALLSIRALKNQL